MKLLHVSQTYAPYLENGGRAVKVPALTEQLVDRGHEVTVVTSDFHRGETWRDEHDGVKVVYLASLAEFHRVTLNPGLVGYLRRRLSEFDLVHVHGLFDLLGPATGLACRREDIPYVVEPLGMSVPRGRSQVPKRIYHHLLGKPLLNGADRIIATSETEAEDLASLGYPEDAIGLRRNGTDVDFHQELPPDPTFREDLGIPDEASLLLWVGRISMTKDLDQLVHAVSRLDSSVHLAIVGPENGDGMYERTNQAIRETGTQDRVHLPGPRFDEEKLEALADADAFALPSEYESFGNAAAEAIIAGLPTLVTQNCGIAPHVREAGGLVVPHDAEAIAAGLDRILHDTKLRENFETQRTRVIDDLSWKQPLEDLEAIYEEASRQAN